MKLFKMGRIMPKMNISSMTGFKKSDFSVGVGVKGKKRRRRSIKSMLKEV